MGQVPLGNPTGDQSPSPEAAVAMLQNACLHDQGIWEQHEKIEGNWFIIRQCRTCGMFNPPVRGDRPELQQTPAVP